MKRHYKKKCPQHPFIIIAQTKKIWVCIMTSPSTTFLELQCQTSHSLIVIACFSATFYCISTSVSLLCHWAFHLIDILTLADESSCFYFSFPCSSIFNCYPSFCSWNINCPWYLHLFFLLRVSLTVWTGNFSKPIDFDQTVLSWIIYERWLFNLTVSHNSSPLWCKY